MGKDLEGEMQFGIRCEGEIFIRPEALPELKPRPNLKKLKHDPLEEGHSEVGRFTKKFRGGAIQAAILIEEMPRRYADTEIRFLAKENKAEVLVVRDASRRTQMFFDAQAGVDLSTLVRMVSERECALHRRYSKDVGFDWADYWRMSERDGILTNSKFPTRVSLDEILEMVRLVADPKAFDRRREGECLRGNCGSVQYNECHLYKHELPQCVANTRLRIIDNREDQFAD
ncbi:MAG: hypothetical protein WCJ29_02935 [bacterium]